MHIFAAHLLDIWKFQRLLLIFIHDHVILELKSFKHFLIGAHRLFMLIFIPMIILNSIGISIGSDPALHEPIVSHWWFEAHEILLVVNFFLCRVLACLRFRPNILYMTLFDIILKDIIHFGIILKVITFQSLELFIFYVFIESSFSCIYMKLEMCWFTVNEVFVYSLWSSSTRNLIVSILFWKWTYILSSII